MYLTYLAKRKKSNFSTFYFHVVSILMLDETQIAHLNASVEIVSNLGQINRLCLEIRLSVSNVSLSQSTKHVFGSVTAYLHLTFKCQSP